MSFRAKKSLGQHFLHDPNMIQKIVDALQADPGDRIVEIGPGQGALTESLLETYDDVHAIEVDERSVTMLKDRFPALNIHQADVLEFNWEKVTADGKAVKVIGNLPYYITSPILFGILEVRAHLEEAVLMMQKEVAERLVAVPRTKAYGILSVQVQLMSEVEKLFDIPPQVFKPRPKVDSSLVRLRFHRPKLQCSDEHLKQVVRTAFNKRRKTLRNALKPVLGDYRPEEFDLGKRAEELKPDDYEMLTVHLEQNGILT